MKFHAEDYLQTMPILAAGGQFSVATSHKTYDNLLKPYETHRHEFSHKNSKPETAAKDRPECRLHPGK